jgi:hypothetical protein
MAFIAEVMVNWHVGLVPALAQAPPQPINSVPADGVAVSVTDVPDAKLAEHVEPVWNGTWQLIAAELSVTIAVPEPEAVTESV